MILSKNYELPFGINCRDYPELFNIVNDILKRLNLKEISKDQWDVLLNTDITRDNFMSVFPSDEKFGKFLTLLFIGLESYIKGKNDKDDWMLININKELINKG